MAENNFVPPTEALSEPELRRTNSDPKGVLQKNLKIFVYLGAALLVIAAALFSSTAKKTPAQQAAAKGQPPQPTLQDNTDNNVQDLKNQLKAEREKEQQQVSSHGCSRWRSCARVCDTRATGRRRGLWADRRCGAMCSGPTLPTTHLRSGGLWSTGQCAASTLAGTAAGTAHRRKGARASRRVTLRLESCVRPCHGTATTSAGTGPS
jgi:hypothetical protein